VIWFKFIICVVIILFSGTKLARYGDAIAEKTGLGRVWVGLILLALITSMPEMVTGVSSVSLVGLPDLGMGTLLGSCIFNIAIITLLDVLSRQGPVLNRANSSHILLASVGAILAAMAAGFIFAGESLSGLALGWLGISSILILIVYLFAVRLIFRHERKRQQALPIEPKKYGNYSNKAIWLKFGLAAVAVIGAGIWLSFVGDEISETYRLDTTFVGSLFLAIATSMPELVVAVTALRLGAVDMAVADILGANMLDLTHIFVIDLFFIKGTVLASVSNAHIITTIVIILMSLIVILGLRFRQKHKTFFVVSWYALALIALYIIGAFALFSTRLDIS
jgi:cation:H+ antiporter